MSYLLPNKLHVYETESLRVLINVGRCRGFDRDVILLGYAVVSVLRSPWEGEKLKMLEKLDINYGEKTLRMDFSSKYHS